MCRKSIRDVKSLDIRFGGPQAIKTNEPNSNRVTTARYTLLTWAPLSLAYQFLRAANVYFLFISILTSMYFSPKQPASMIGTFALVLIFTMFKEAYEDFARHKSDKQLNTTVTKVYDYNSREFVVKQWQQVKAGDLVKIEKDSPIPADILQLQSSDQKGLSYVETMNLDGETNLKEKYSPKETQNLGLQEIIALKGEVSVDGPNEFLDSWNGNLTLEGQQTFNCGLRNLLLRGCNIKNTDYIYGFVVYTGPESKIMMNAKNPPHKISNVFRLMNYILYSVFGFQLLLISVYATLSYLWQVDNASNHYYLDLDPQVDAGTWFVQLLTYWVAYSHLIPISLYVGLEVLKLGLSMQINGDYGLYDPESEQFAKVRNSDLIEELGQVSFVFSDKTGTLTCNKMDFKQCTVGQKIYGTYQLPHMKKAGEIDQEEQCELEQAKHMIANGPTGSYDSNDINALREFFRFMSICHSVSPEKVNGQIVYQASSPDEKALVVASQRQGYVYFEKSTTGIKIKDYNDEEFEYQFELEIPFDSDRKRQSVILVHNGETWIYCKGADSIMMPLIDFTDLQAKETLDRHLEKFSMKGLRTLVMAQKKLDDQAYQNWKQRYDQATTISDEKEKVQKLNELYAEVEAGLTYIGGSAIEDQLQDRVPETIKSIMSANIKVWVLTGDKQGTAIEIGKSCNLIGGEIDHHILSAESEEEFKRYLEEAKKKYVVDKLFAKFGLVVDGKTLTMILSDKNLSNDFFDLGEQANSVICCRVSPKQKSQVVKLAKDKKKYITLAIGDGANDVSMIMEAHIGVGIRGKEGTQAVRSADYAISQFQFLNKLLLFHGRLGYKRIAYFICYYFYKNIVLVLTELYFALYNGYSGQIFFADWLSMLYNALWTSWPCLFYFGLDIDANAKNSLKFPELYSAGHQNFYFNMKTFWKWMFFAAIHGAICFFIPVYGLKGALDESGKTQEFWFTSCLSFTCIVHIVTYKLFIETSSWNFTSGAITVMSLYLYYFCVIIGSSKNVAFMFQPEVNELYFSILWMFKPWFLLIVLPFICLLPDMMWKMINRIYFPTGAELVMKLQAEQEVNLTKNAKKNN